MAVVVGIVSGKGGVGKSTLCTCLALSLAGAGKKVLCIDGDAGLKNLDLLMGLESRTVFDVADVLAERCALHKALVAHPIYPTLQLLSAAHDYSEHIDPRALRALCDSVGDRFDFILIDAPAGLGDGFQAAVYAADRALVVATPDLTSICDAERTASLILTKRNMPVHLVINRVRPALMRKGDASGVDEMMDKIGLPLIGLIPEDEQVIVCSNRQGLRLGEKTQSATAFRNIAERLTGKETALAPFWHKYAKKN